MLVQYQTLTVDQEVSKMANLRVDKITSTETFETTGSVQFDGNGDHLDVGSAGDFNYLHNGAASFTAEFWVYPQLVNSR